MGLNPFSFQLKKKKCVPCRAITFFEPKALKWVIEKLEQYISIQLYWYGYCLNNPLSYTDPSGESFLALGLFILGSGIIKAVFDGPDSHGNWNWGDAGRGFLQGATISATMVGSIYLPGLASATWSPFMTSLYMGGTTFASTAMTSGLMSWSYSGSFDVNWGAAAMAGGVAFGLSALNYLSNSTSEQSAINGINGQEKSEGYVENFCETKTGIGEGDWNISDITTDTPYGYYKDQSTGSYYKYNGNTKEYIGGVTRRGFFSGNTKVFISPYATKNDIYLEMVCRHELTHAYHYYKGLDFMYGKNMFKSFSENASYRETLSFLRDVPYINNSQQWTSIRLSCSMQLQKYPFSHSAFTVPKFPIFTP